MKAASSRARATSTRPQGRAKVVRYADGDEARGEFKPNDEVDEICWLSPEDAVAAPYPTTKTRLSAAEQI